MTVKERLHRLVDTLPKSELHAAQRLLEYLRDRGTDPFLRTLLEAPVDDETETTAERDAIKEAYSELKTGRVVGHEKARRQLLDKP